MKWFSTSIAFLILLIPFDAMSAIDALTAVTMHTTADGGKTYSLSLQIVAVMTALSILPALLMTMTSFTRIIIVLAILRQAMGMATTPTNQILIGIALFLTLFIMGPVFNQVNQTALQPYLAQKISPQSAVEKAQIPVREFMLKQTRKNDLNVFAKMAGINEIVSEDDVPFRILMPAFLTSELKTAFQIGFIIFIPFLIIDLVVASVLMSMGMMMLSPLIISLPFKILLFVLIDGWTLIAGTLAGSFGM